MALSECLIIQRLVGSRFSGVRASVHFVYDELQKFGSILFSKLTVQCDEHAPQDGSLAVYLTLQISPTCSPVGRLF